MSQEQKSERRNPRDCPRTNCTGRLLAMLSDDGSCYECDRCTKCGATWWNNPPLPPCAAPSWCRAHDLKTWPKYFEAVLSGAKAFEIRKHDRPFAVDDMLLLREWDPDAMAYTGRSIVRRVAYLTPGGEWGLPQAVCVLGFEGPRGV